MKTDPEFIILYALSNQRNPDIKLYALPWGFPGWIGQGKRDPYTKPEVTADYIIRWINGAKTVYNLTIDYVGVSFNTINPHQMKNFYGKS